VAEAAAALVVNGEVGNEGAGRAGAEAGEGAGPARSLETSGVEEALGTS